MPSFNAWRDSCWALLNALIARQEREAQSTDGAQGVPMSESISAFDGNFVRLRQVAALLAQERPQCAFEDVMDLLKRSVFAGEFEPPSFEVGETREDPRNWLHVEIEAPRCMLPAVQAALSVRPKQLYGVNRSTITSVLLTTDALPGGWVEWEPLLDVSAPPYTARVAARRLAPDEVAGPQSSSAETSTSEARPVGRPQKRAWPRVVELVRQLAAEHPDWQKKELAGEAWKRASKEFSEHELPSEATIQRHMAEILGGGSG